MKIQIEITDQLKVIRLEESINLEEFFSFLQKRFPNDEWKEYKLEFLREKEPIVITIKEKEYVPFTPEPFQSHYPNTFWWQAPITVSSDYETTDIITNVR